MLGKPKFKYDDNVWFEIENTDGWTPKNRVVYGKITIIDEYGTFFDKSDVSYDIYSDKDKCLYKHINEKMVHKDDMKMAKKNLDTPYNKAEESEEI